MDDWKTAKAEVRRTALLRRDGMDEMARIEASLLIGERIVEELAFDPGTIVSGFLPIRSEVDLRPAMSALSDRGARLCVPAIVGGELEFRHLARGAPLESQGFGTLSPGADAAVFDPEIMLMPLAAFDRGGRRLGYGRGFYDRAVERLRRKGLRPLLVGVAFAVQEMDVVPVEPHDVPLDLVVTEAFVWRSAS